MAVGLLGQLKTKAERCRGEKKPPGCGARRFLEGGWRCYFIGALASPSAGRCENQKYAKK
jgi:hypothetical protein